MQKYFLKSGSTARALAESVEPEGKHILEIGGGNGKLTEKIVEKADKVTVIEKDSKLARTLRKNYNAQIIEEDFEKADIPEFDACCSNPPFYISSEITDFLGQRQALSSLIVQKEFALKIVAEPGTTRYCWKTIKSNLDFVPVKLRDLSKNHFDPKPDVDTSILKLYPNKERHSLENREEFQNNIKPLFNNKSKKLRNAFVDSRHKYGVKKEKAKNIRDKIPYSEKRVKQLSINDLEQVSKTISKILKS